MRKSLNLPRPSLPSSAASKNGGDAPPDPPPDGLFVSRDDNPRPKAKGLAALRGAVRGVVAAQRISKAFSSVRPGGGVSRMSQKAPPPGGGADAVAKAPGSAPDASTGAPKVAEDKFTAASSAASSTPPQPSSGIAVSGADSFGDPLLDTRMAPGLVDARGDASVGSGSAGRAGSSRGVPRTASGSSASLPAEPAPQPKDAPRGAPPTAETTRSDDYAKPKSTRRGSGGSGPESGVGGFELQARGQKLRDRDHGVESQSSRTWSETTSQASKVGGKSAADDEEAKTSEKKRPEQYREASLRGKIPAHILDGPTPSSSSAEDPGAAKEKGRLAAASETRRSARKSAKNGKQATVEDRPEMIGEVGFFERRCIFGSVLKMIQVPHFGIFGGFLVIGVCMDARK